MPAKLQIAVSGASLIFQKRFPDAVVIYSLHIVHLVAYSNKKAKIKNDHQNYLSLVMRKPELCMNAKTKAQISFAVTAQLISAFLFATQIVQFPNSLKLKFQASSYLLWLNSPNLSDLVGNPEDRFFHNEAHLTLYPLYLLDASAQTNWFITQIRLCNILQYFTAVKIVIFQ